MLEFIRPLVVFMVDCTEGMTHRDMTLLQEIHQLGLSVIVCLNKVDLIPPHSIKAIVKELQAYLVFAKHIPIIPLVATTGEGIGNILKMIDLLYKENHKRI